MPGSTLDECFNQIITNLCCNIAATEWFSQKCIGDHSSTVLLVVVIIITKHIISQLWRSFVHQCKVLEILSSALPDLLSKTCSKSKINITIKKSIAMIKTTWSPQWYLQREQFSALPTPLSTLCCLPAKLMLPALATTSISFSPYFCPHQGFKSVCLHSHHQQPEQ